MRQGRVLDAVVQDDRLRAVGRRGPRPRHAVARDPDRAERRHQQEKYQHQHSGSAHVRGNLRLESVHAAIS